MKYYTTKTHSQSKRFVVKITLLLALFLSVYALYLKREDSVSINTPPVNNELEYIPNELDSDSQLLEPLSSETSFPGGMPSFLQKTRHDPEIMNIEDNLESNDSTKK